VTLPRFSLDRTNKLLLHKHHLSEVATDSSLVQTVGNVGGLHASAATVPYLSLWARRERFAKEELQTALYDEPRLGKVLCVRNTLFILPRELLPTAYQATKKRRDAVLDRYLRHHEISRSQYERACAEITDILGNGAKTTAEMKEELGDPGLSITVDLMPNDWRLVRGRPRGTWRSNLHEYAAFEAWFPDVDLHSVTPEEARLTLVEHYLAALGPATEADMVWWSGLGKSEIRSSLDALAEKVTVVQVEGLKSEHFMPTSDLHELERDHTGARSVFLLPGLDPYVMGHKDRRRFLADERYHQVFDRAGNALPTVWHDGQVIGVWLEDRKRTMVEVLLFEGAEEAVTSHVHDEARRLSGFLEHDPVNVRIKLYPDDVYPKTPFSVARHQ
jgi:uncharacterized protein YcaQ